LNGLECAISAVSELELFAKKDIQDQEIADIEELIKDCILIEVLSEVRLIAKRLIIQHKLRLPDAIIAATAIHNDLPFLTADKHFVNIDELQLFLFQF
jgi:predicted nucleic acid-binding protein